jgi:exopolyphosphatase / guanosine-5'-triphosphate,3'-diphosphate pyrophosphatase
LSAVHLGLAEYDPDTLHLSRLSMAAIGSTTADLVGMTRDQRAAIGSMHPGRVDVIAAGAIVVRTLAEEVAARSGITELVVSEHDILDGIALSLSPEATI